MCRLLGWVARPGLTLREVLGGDSFEAFARLSRIHADGWGMAYAEAGGDGMHKSTACADTDPAFTELATGLATEAALAHLRWATPGLPVQADNTHPFRHGRTAFAHNGAILPLEHLSTLLPPVWHARLKGTTDSEHYFLAVMAEVEEGGVDVPTAIARVAARLAEDYQPSSLNAMLLTPDALYVVNCHDPSAVPAVPSQGASQQGLVELVEEAAPYFDLRYRRTERAVVVASSGVGQPKGAGWRLMDNNTVLVVDRATMAVELVPFDVRLGVSRSSAECDATI